MIAPSLAPDQMGVSEMGKWNKEEPKQAQELTVPRLRPMRTRSLLSTLASSKQYFRPARAAAKHPLSLGFSDRVALDDAGALPVVVAGVTAARAFPSPCSSSSLATPSEENEEEQYVSM